MVEKKNDAVPRAHPQLNRWRDVLRAGFEFLHADSDLVVTGGIDGVWIDRAQHLLAVDNKATAKDGEVDIDAPWQDEYKRRIEVYPWLFRRNCFQVSDTG